MKLKYSKKDVYEIHAPNTIALFTDMMRSETNKKYLTLKQCARILYSLSQSVVGWTENDYKTFIGTLNSTTITYYTTQTTNNKGVHVTINRDNIQTCKNDLDYLLKLFSTIIPLMIMDRRRRLYVE